MPNPKQIDPKFSRERGLFETDEQYEKRMAYLDHWKELFDSLPKHEPGKYVGGHDNG